MKPPPTSLMFKGVHTHTQMNQSSWDKCIFFLWYRIFSTLQFEIFMNNSLKEKLFEF